MNRTSVIACLAALVCTSVVATANAQESQNTSAAVTQAAPAAPAQAAPPAKPTPSPTAWHGTLSGGLAIAAGVQAQRGYQLGATLKREIFKNGSLVANGSRQYQRVTFPDESLLTDRTSLTVGIDTAPKKHMVAMVRSMYLKDKTMYVNSRFEQLVGAGVHLYDTEHRFDFQFVPGFSLFKQDLGYSDIYDWETGWGFFEKFTAKITKTWTFENSFRFRTNFKDDDKSIESVTSLQGLIVKGLSMQLEYQYNHESIVPPGYPAYLSVLSAGLRFQF